MRIENTTLESLRLNRSETGQGQLRKWKLDGVDDAGTAQEIASRNADAEVGSEQLIAGNLRLSCHD